MSQCIVPDTFNGVRRSHSDDLVEVFHGYATPTTACGFHATYYMPEVSRARAETERQS